LIHHHQFKRKGKKGWFALMTFKKNRMKKASLFAVLFIFSAHAFAQFSQMLDIPSRLQWQNAHGYCGETSIQMIGLYYGDYISQDVCRKVAGGEVLINVNDSAALEALSFTFKEWNPGQAQPQYQNYLVWVKQYLNKKHPVILTVYVQGLSDPDYDHIFPAIGFSAQNLNAYSVSDQLSYNSCFDTTSFTRGFGAMWDTRPMTGNGATNTYCIPRDVNYGCAVTGIKDVLKATRPVHLKLDTRDEANVSLAASPTWLHATITADSLTPGLKYALIRYNNYLTVPSSNFNPLTASSAVYFIAGGVQKLTTDSFMSNTAVFYRCIPYNFTGIAGIQSTGEYYLHVFPNPSKGLFTLEVPGFKDTEKLRIFNYTGQLMKTLEVKEEKQQIDIQELPEGIYYVGLESDNLQHMQKVIKLN
jgi:hypothetical protein